MLRIPLSKTKNDKTSTARAHAPTVITHALLLLLTVGIAHWRLGLHPPTSTSGDLRIAPKSSGFTKRTSSTDKICRHQKAEQNCCNTQHGTGANEGEVYTALCPPYFDDPVINFCLNISAIVSRSVTKTINGPVSDSVQLLTAVLAKLFTVGAPEIDMLKFYNLGMQFVSWTILLVFGARILSGHRKTTANTQSCKDGKDM